MKKISLLFFVLLAIPFCSFAQSEALDTLNFYNGDTLVVKVINHNEKIVTVKVGIKEMRLASSEIESIHFSDGKVVFLATKNFKYIENLKKGNKLSNLITIYPVGPMFNTVSLGYEKMNKKRGIYASRLGMVTPIFSNAGTLRDLNGPFVEFGFKKIFSEPLRISGLSVRPAWQGFFWEISTGISYLSFNYHVGSDFFQTSQNYKGHSMLFSGYFSCGYSTIISPKFLLGFGIGVGVSAGNISIDDKNATIKPSFYNESIGFQKYVSHPISLKSFLLIGYLF